MNDKKFCADIYYTSNCWFIEIILKQPAYFGGVRWKHDQIFPVIFKTANFEESETWQLFLLFHWKHICVKLG
jgi:hypothetical protein